MPDIFLRQGEANPADVKLRDTTTSDSASFTSTATWDQAAASWAATAAEAFDSTATFSQAAASWSASASEAFTATATWSQVTATWSATGAEDFAGTGAWTQAAAAWSGTATEAFTAAATFGQAPATWAATAALDESRTFTAAWEQAATWAATATGPEAAGPPELIPGRGLPFLPRRQQHFVFTAAFTQEPASWAADMTYDEQIEWLVLDELVLIGA